MRYERIALSGWDSDVYLDMYIPCTEEGLRRKALLVLPGGGYWDLSQYREGEAIAHAFLPYGYAAFVLHYSVGRQRPFPAQLIEAAQAISYIKDNADEFGIDPAWVLTVGFSAGGHLAGMTGTLWKHPAIYDALDIPYGYNKPRGMMLIYPVIGPEHHFNSFQNLLCCDTPDQAALDALTLYKQVDQDTVPAFLMHTANDDVVSVTGSLAMAQAMSAADRPYELHIYPDAPHGVALGNEITACGNRRWVNAAIARWVEQAAAWADSLTEE